MNPTHLAVRIAALSLCGALALPAQTLEHTVDPSITPGDDFFAYANGAWLRATTIPPGKNRWSARDEIEVRTRARVDTLLDEARTGPRGSLARKIDDFRAAWLDEAAIDAKGRAPIEPLLDSIDAIADRRALTRMIARSMRADVDPLNWGIYRSSSLLGLSVEPSIHGEKTYVAFLLQGGLGLGDREQYLNADARARSVRAKYEEYVSGLLAFAGVHHADQRAAAVLALETAIAQTHATTAQSANDHNADSVWTRADFARCAPGIDWPDFLAAAGLGQQESFVAWQPTAITGLAALLASQPLDVWKDYLRFHVVHEYVDVLPRTARWRALAFRGPEKPRAKRAIEATQSALGDAIGRLYAERYFPAEQKARVLRIVGAVTDAFIKRVEVATWLSPATRTTALTKLKSLYVGIGYPEQWQDDSDLVVDRADPVGNLRRVAERTYHRALGRIGRPVDVTEWRMTPQRVGAVLVFQQNAYDFTAALLQSPKFDATASDAAAYGAIGAVIGHDVTHFVDVLGAEYGIGGTLRRWWTADDASRYEALVTPLVTQFGAYHPFPGTAIDGKLTQTENVADLAGLAAAFDAYRQSLGARAADRSYVRQRDREFFIAFAQAWRTKTNESALRAKLASDHAPEMYRIATVRNLDAWYEAFDVRPGQRLYLAPEARVRIW
jgi:predicted metalloendopeptidase